MPRSAPSQVGMLSASRLVRLAAASARHRSMARFAGDAPNEANKKQRSSSGAADSSSQPQTPPPAAGDVAAAEPSVAAVSPAGTLGPSPGLPSAAGTAGATGEDCSMRSRISTTVSPGARVHCTQALFRHCMQGQQKQQLGRPAAK